MGVEGRGTYVHMYLFYISGSLYHVLSLAPICFGPQLLGLQLRQHSSEIWLCLLSFMDTQYTVLSVVRDAYELPRVMLAHSAIRKWNHT